MADEGCVKGTENEQRIIALERDVSEMKSDIKEIKDRLLGRPTWIVTVLITLLSSACVGLLVTVLRIKLGV